MMRTAYSLTAATAFITLLATNQNVSADPTVTVANPPTNPAHTSSVDDPGPHSIPILQKSAALFRHLLSGHHPAGSARQAARGSARFGVRLVPPKQFLSSGRLHQLCDAVDLCPSDVEHPVRLRHGVCVRSGDDGLRRRGQCSHGADVDKWELRQYRYVSRRDGVPARLRGEPVCGDSSLVGDRCPNATGS